MVSLAFICSQDVAPRPGCLGSRPILHRLLFVPGLGLASEAGEAVLAGLLLEAARGKGRRLPSWQMGGRIPRRPGAAAAAASARRGRRRRPADAARRGGCCGRCLVVGTGGRGGLLALGSNDGRHPGRVGLSSDVLGVGQLVVLLVLHPPVLEPDLDLPF